MGGETLEKGSGVIDKMRALMSERINFSKALSLDSMGDPGEITDEEFEMSFDEAYGIDNYDFKSVEDALEVASKPLDKKKVYKTVVGHVASARKFSKERIKEMLGDTEFEGALFSALESDVDEKQLKLAYVGLHKYSPDVEFNTLLVSGGRDAMKRRKMNKLIYEDSAVAGTFLEKSKELSDKRSKGGIDDATYYRGMDTLYAEAAKKSGNKELKKLYKTDDSAFVSDVFDKVDSEIKHADEVKVTDKKEAVGAMNSVEESLAVTSFKVKFSSDNGEARIYTDDSVFSFLVSIYKDKKTDEFKFYLSDKYSHGTEVGPFTSLELAGAVDARRIDSYITHKTSEFTADPRFLEDISNLPDDQLVRLGMNLIGNSARRNWAMTSVNRTVLDNLVKMLITVDKRVDKRYPTMFDKVRALNLALEKSEGNKERAVKLLAAGSTPQFFEILDGSVYVEVPANVHTDLQRF